MSRRRPSKPVARFRFAATAAMTKMLGAAETSEMPAFNGCSADDYEDRAAGDDERVIAIAQMGLTYTPKCMIVAAGQRVRWEGSLSAHPLAPGEPDDPSAGSAGSPIELKGSGSVAEFAFATPGTFPNTAPCTRSARDRRWPAWCTFADSSSASDIPRPHPTLLCAHRDDLARALLGPVP